jgi:hypothetical protein
MNHKQLNILITHINEEYAYKRKVKNKLVCHGLLICFITLTLTIVYYEIGTIKYRISNEKLTKLIIDQKILELMFICLNIALILAIKRTINIANKYLKLY